MSSQPLPERKDLRHYVYIVLLFISRLSKSLWVFFPGILVLLILIICLWTLNQGKDIVTAFAENPIGSTPKLLFFIAITYWVYVSWYSARIIAYLKGARQRDMISKICADYTEEKQKESLSNTKFYEIPQNYLENFPRLIGFSCLLVVQLAVLQSPLLEEKAVAPGTAVWLFFVGLLGFFLLNMFIRYVAEKNYEYVRWGFIFSSVLFLACALLNGLYFKNAIISLGWLLLLLELVFIFYINRRRKLVDRSNIKAYVGSTRIHKRLVPVLQFLRLPPGEVLYFIVFTAISGLGLFVYVWTIVDLRMAWAIGPFPFLILALAVLLGIANIITALSLRLNFNLHFLFFLFAVIITSKETHYIRFVKPPLATNVQHYDQRKTFHEYLREWIARRTEEIDKAPEANGYPVYFVLANGGASRSGYWTASVLDSLEDITKSTSSRFSRNLFCLSGASGGSVGNATFFALLKEQQQDSSLISESFTTAATSYLKTDFLTFTLARMLGPDYLRYIFHINLGGDRADALETAFEYAADKDTARLKPKMGSRFSTLLAVSHKLYNLPILCINVTRMQDGNPGVVANIKLDARTFNNRVDVADSIDQDQDINLSTATILGARFPYLSPAGRIKDQYFVDGGYFDNSGSGVVQEMIREILNEGRNTTDTILQRISKLNLKVIHITNSPGGSVRIEPVPPIKNDLMAPILTIIGSYDMQTTVNDERLKNYIEDIQSGAGGKKNRAAYYEIPLYKDLDELTGIEKQTGKEKPYPMNWFISETTRKRMDDRLKTHRRFKQLALMMTAK